MYHFEIENICLLTMNHFEIENRPPLIANCNFSNGIIVFGFFFIVRFVFSNILVFFRFRVFVNSVSSSVMTIACRGGRLVVIFWCFIVYDFGLWLVGCIDIRARIISSVGIGNIGTCVKDSMEDGTVDRYFVLYGNDRIRALFWYPW